MKTHTIRLKLMAILALMMAAFTMAAQEAQDPIEMCESRDHSLSLELFGAHNTIGINYDRRFKGNDGLGFRVGLGYGYSESSSFLIGSYNIHGVSAPLEINYLFGKGRHHLELGFGASLGFYREKLHAQDVHIPYGNDNYGSYDITYKRSTFGYFMYGNVGYRLQTNRGFQFRIGLTPSVNFGDKYCLQRDWFYPYISFGWRLK